MANDSLGPEAKWYAVGAYTAIHGFLRTYGPKIVEAFKERQKELQRQLKEERERTAEALNMGRAAAEEQLERLEKENAALREEERERMEEVFQLRLEIERLKNQTQTDER